MDFSDLCPVCEQPTNFCHRAKRSGREFTVMLLNSSWNYSVKVPCYFKARLETICPSKWMVVKGGMNLKHHICLDIDNYRNTITMCGPYMMSLVDAFDLKKYDTLTFTLDEHTTIFNLHAVSTNGVIRSWTAIPELQNVPEQCEEALEKAYFTNIIDLTQSEMNSIINCMQILLPKWNDEENIPKFYIKRIDDDDEYKLEIPITVFDSGYSIPMRGDSIFIYEENIARGFYEKHAGDNITFEDGWTEFLEMSKLSEDDLFIAMVDTSSGCISLEFMKIIP